jgi:hypothetical protein
MEKGGVYASKKFYNYNIFMAIRVGKVAAIGTWPWLLEATNHFGGALSTAMDRHLSRECAASLSSEPAGDWRR